MSSNRLSPKPPLPRLVSLRTFQISLSDCSDCRVAGSRRLHRPVSSDSHWTFAADRPTQTRFLQSLDKPPRHAWLSLRLQLLTQTYDRGARPKADCFLVGPVRQDGLGRLEEKN
eukprot:767973-Hanusia_phi.AAC.6